MESQQQYTWSDGLRVYTRCHLGPDREFLPRDTLNTLITEENVKSSLGTRNESLARIFRPQKHLADLNLIKVVIEEARVVFAILVILGRSQFTKSLLIDEGLRDEHLPLSIDHENSCCRSHDGRKIIPFVNWPQADLDEFVNHKQWFYLAPVLTSDGGVIQLHEKCPLPFIGDDGDPARGGGGFVYKAKVHPAHQEGFEVETSDLMVAVKEFYKKESFLQENRILERIKDLRHAHVIRHLTSIERGDRKSYSIFPWTDGGTLQDFWHKPSKELDEEYVLWAFKQMHGLASAIQALHEIFKCRHGDLKPQNILCFEENGKSVFKVADFGISKVHEIPTIYRKVATTNLAYTASYQGPEVEFERVDPKDQQPRSRKYDIWSLGCVFLEFSVWLLHGPLAMVEFDNARETSGSSMYEVTDRERKRARVHRLAHGTVDSLLNDPRCTGETALAELLKIIGTRMLITEVGDRASAKDVTELLSHIISRYMEGSLRLFNHHHQSDIPQLQFGNARRT